MQPLSVTEIQSTAQKIRANVGKVIVPADRSPVSSATDHPALCSNKLICLGGNVRRREHHVVLRGKSVWCLAFPLISLDLPVAQKLRTNSKVA